MLAIISALFLVAAVFTSITIVDASLGELTTPIGTYMVGLLAPTVAGIVAAWKANQASVKADKTKKQIDEIQEIIVNGNGDIQP